MIRIALTDGSIWELEEGSSALELAGRIGSGVHQEALVAEINGTVTDLSQVLKHNDTVALFGFEDKAGAHALRHTSAHILAQAVKRLFPGTLLAIGPAVDNGFFYDFDSDHVFVEGDFDAIEEEMRKIVDEAHEIERFELERSDAIEFVKRNGELYKVELIRSLPEEAVFSFYRQGEFIDLCAGSHVPSTAYVKAFKLLRVAGAYWRGDASRKMLQRIYGTAFTRTSALESYLSRLEESKKRDHRKLGKALKLFTLMEEGPGFPFLLPKGVIVKNKLLEYWREIHARAGYQEIETPVILSRQLWETSGHWQHYKENMYSLTIDGEDWAIKPMNCPGAILVYSSEPRSYKDLPLRYSEIGRVHRHELSGTLYGLMRVRAFTQDDAHIFMMPEQIQDEIQSILKLVETLYKAFGFQYRIELSTRPVCAIGTQAEWDAAENALKDVLEKLELPYRINPGDGAFYGPKINFILEDCIGRTWQCGTVQLDMQLPQRFDLSYTGADGEKHRPVVIHRVIFGSIERFLGLLIEEFAGKFPTWLAPVQVKIVAVSERQTPYCRTVKEALEASGIRVDLDDRAEKVGYKIREAELDKVPYTMVIGDAEAKDNVVSVRSRDKGDLGSQPLETFVAMLLEEIKAKAF